MCAVQGEPVDRHQRPDRSDAELDRRARAIHRGAADRVLRPPAHRFFIRLLPRSGPPVDQPVAIASRIAIMADVPLIQLSVTVSA